MTDVDADSVRKDVLAWLDEHWDPELSLMEWREVLVDSGWGKPAWPLPWFGRGLPGSLESTVRDAFHEIGAVGVAPGSGAALVGPTILEHGSDEMKGRLLRPLLTGEHLWCQLFSEPDAGSDLAALTTRAERDGDGWVVNGQKVWNSGAHHAQYGMLLARTNVDVPKHAGITYFALDMDQPGVEVRPLVQMNGYSSFNEVFLENVRVSEADVIGRVGGGWSVAMTTLAHERRPAPKWAPRKQLAHGRCVDEARAETTEALSPYTWYRNRSGRVDLAIPLARELGRTDDPTVRQEIARLLTLEQCVRWTAERARESRALGRAPGPESSLNKLYASTVARTAARVHSLIAGPHATLSGPDAVFRGDIAEILVSVPGISIAGGTDEIQHNIIGERVLGLPKEPEHDRDVTFREALRSRAPQ